MKTHRPTWNVCLHALLQVVFRKIADVLREKELAERDRYDPPVELSTDHPVRRLISRFRKMSCSRLPSGVAGLPLAELNPGDALTVEQSLQALPGRKTHSVDATNCSSADASSRPSTSDGTNIKCTVSNGGTGVGSGSAAWRRLLSRTASVDVTNTAAAAAVVALPSNGDKTSTGNISSTRRNNEERALLSDNAVPRTPRSKWSSLLSRVNIPDITTTSADEAAAENEVFVDEEASERSSAVKDVAADRSAGTLDETVELQTSDGELGSSSGADDVAEQKTLAATRRRQGVVVLDETAARVMVDLRSELNRQLGAVHERIDDISQRLEVVLRLLVDMRPPQRRSADLPAGYLS